MSGARLLLAGAGALGHDSASWCGQVGAFAWRELQPTTAGHGQQMSKERHQGDYLMTNVLLIDC
jgi:hypothetical protein